MEQFLYFFLYSDILPHFLKKINSPYLYPITKIHGVSFFVFVMVSPFVKIKFHKNKKVEIHTMYTFRIVICDNRYEENINQLIPERNGSVFLAKLFPTSASCTFHRKINKLYDIYEKHNLFHVILCFEHFYTVP